MKTIFAAAIISTTVASALAVENYCFPSHNPPGGKAPSEVKQFVTFLWDDNAYSGLAGTLYEDESGSKKTVSLTDEASWGMSWAVRRLAGERQNPDGSPVSMTFNVISGQLAPMEYDAAISDYKGYKGARYKTESWEDGKLGDFAVAWGREQPFTSLAPWHMDGQEDPVKEGPIKMIYEEALEKGHEIGNHTLDHMETNSPLPKEYWPNNGEGFDTDPNEGENSAKPSWETMGWLTAAGNSISEKAWSDAHELSEELLKEHLNLTAGENMYAFRAPRLEINSGCLYALKERSYLYDCSLEEGYEENRDGTNFLWPYTMDNGSVNAWTQKSWGDPKALDSLPAGLWQYPVNVMIVPEELRSAVIEKRKIIAQAEGEDISDLDEWDGKITGFDFNLFIYWNMTGEQVLKTYQYTLDKRLAGNRAPLQLGCHTDYFTPIYDNATLKEDPVYKHVLSTNTYRDRIATYESFADYALEKGAYLLSGKAVIDSVKALQEGETVGAQNDLGALATQWEFSGDSVGSSTAQESLTSLESVSVNMGARIVVNDDWDNGKYPSASFASYFDAGTITEATHISLNYKTTAPLLLQLYFEGDENGSREVLLNNVGPEVHSGKIPLSAFDYSQYYSGTKMELDVTKIIGIGVAPQTVGEHAEEVTFGISDLSLYGTISDITPVKSVDMSVTTMAVNGLKNNQLNLTVPQSGRYNLNCYSVNGRLIHSLSGVSLNAGASSVAFPAPAAGIYLMKIENSGTGSSTVSNLYVK